MEEDEISLEGITGLRRTYDYLPYSHWRIKQVLKMWGVEMVPLWCGYKGNRYPGYVQHYMLVNAETRETINPDITNESLRRFLAHHDIPLTDGDNGRNPKAEAFLEAVRRDSLPGDTQQ